MSVSEAIPSNDVVAVKRPKIITVLAWFLLISAVVGILMSLGTFSYFSVGRNIWNILSRVAVIAAAIGLLKMKRWSAYLYFGLFIINAIGLFVLPASPEIQAQYMSALPLFLMFLVPLIIAMIVFSHWEKMT